MKGLPALPSSLYGPQKAAHLGLGSPTSSSCITCCPSSPHQAKRHQTFKTSPGPPSFRKQSCSLKCSGTAQSMRFTQQHPFSLIRAPDEIEENPAKSESQINSFSVKLYPKYCLRPLANLTPLWPGAHPAGSSRSTIRPSSLPQHRGQASQAFTDAQASAPSGGAGAPSGRIILPLPKREHNLRAGHSLATLAPWATPEPFWTV